MDNDKELLELAAKAAGIEYRADSGYRVTGMGVTGMPLLEKWNPLTNDGDALRLAVKLRLSISIDDRPAGVIRIYVPYDTLPALDEELRGDSNAATRRAIVRAASEIGRAIS